MSATDSTDETPDFLDAFENAEEAKADYVEARELDQKDQQQDIEDHVENLDALSKKERIQRRRRDEKSESYDFYGEQIEFEAPGLGIQKEAIRHFRRLDIDDIEDEEDAGESVDEEFFDFIADTLSGLCADRDLDRAFWEGFNAEELGPLFQSVVTQGVDIDEDVDADEIADAGN